MRATARYSLTCMGEAVSQARNAALSSSSSALAWFAINHSPACWAIAARISWSPAVTDSFPLRHGPPALAQILRQIFLHHIGRHSESLADFADGSVRTDSGESAPCATGPGVARPPHPAARPSDRPRAHCPRTVTLRATAAHLPQGPKRRI